MRESKTGTEKRYKYDGSIRLSKCADNGSAT